VADCRLMHFLRNPVELAAKSDQGRGVSSCAPSRGDRHQRCRRLAGDADHRSTPIRALRRSRRHRDFSPYVRKLGLGCLLASQDGGSRRERIPSSLHTPSVHCPSSVHWRRRDAAHRCSIFENAGRVFPALRTSFGDTIKLGGVARSREIGPQPELQTGGDQRTCQSDQLLRYRRAVGIPWVRSLGSRGGLSHAAGQSAHPQLLDREIPAETALGRRPHQADARLRAELLQFDLDLPAAEFGEPDRRWTVCWSGSGGVCSCWGTDRIAPFVC